MPDRLQLYGTPTLDVGEHSSVGVLFAGHTHDPPPTRQGAVDGASGTLSTDATLRLAHSLFFTGQLATSATRLDSVGSARDQRFSDVAYSGAFRWDDGVRYARMF